MAVMRGTQAGCICVSLVALALALAALLWPTLLAVAALDLARVVATGLALGGVV